MKWILFLVALVVWVARARAVPGGEEEWGHVIVHSQQLTLKPDAGRWTINMDDSLATTATLPSGQRVVISAGEPSLRFRLQEPKDGSAIWHNEDAKISIDVTFDKDLALILHFVAEDAGKFTWPVVKGDATTAYILPMFEGLRIPAADRDWADYLKKQSPLDTTAGLSMPFFATQTAGHTVTYLATNPFNNELAFTSDNGKIGLSFTHEFTRNHPVKEYTLRIVLGGPSDVEPARIFRRWLQSRGEFVSYKEKIAKLPDAEKLLGAAHVYLWGDGVISKYDILKGAELARDLLGMTTAAVRVRSLLDKDHLTALKEIAQAKQANLYDRGRLADALNAVLDRPDFYLPEQWNDLKLPDEALQILKSPRPDRYKLNAILLADSFPNRFTPVSEWGDGFSVKMLKDFRDAGLDRLWLGSPSWRGLRDHQDFVNAAIKQGYLVAPYDSFHSIHSRSEKDTWETAQFGQSLYDSGAVIKADGSKKKGFKQKGYILSPLAARPAVEARVRKLVDEFHCNSWFIDCDAFGEVFDDYSPDHPATQQQDVAERLRRLAWIRDTFRLVIGSEGGSSYAAGTIHFAHGMMTPVIGWGDPDLTDRKSPYFLGRYYPPDQPEVFFKQAPMKPEYRRVYADPRFRIPLYQVALHDSIITTHEWGEGSLKFTDADHARELLELLYGVPPLYHMNLGEWPKQRDAIIAHYQFFSPIHRETAVLPMMDWRPLSEDRLVQKTRFGEKLEVIANFGDQPFEYAGTSIPKQSVLAHWLDGRKAVLYSPR